jgi:two-component system response regulator FixJ
MNCEMLVHAVDDDSRFLAALARSLRGNGLAVVTFGSGEELLAELAPDQPGCIITDLRMPGMDGLELFGRLKGAGIRLPVIFITGHGVARHAVAALKGGAVDFLEKPFTEQILLDSVHQALERNAAEREVIAERTAVQQRFENLTARERTVFALVVSSLHNKDIARELQISPRTVEHHREHLMLKMQARSMAELVTMALLCGVRDLHV